MVNIGNSATAIQRYIQYNDVNLMMAQHLSKRGVKALWNSILLKDRWRVRLTNVVGFTLSQIMQIDGSFNSIIKSMKSIQREKREL